MEITAMHVSLFFLMLTLVSFAEFRTAFISKRWIRYFARVSQRAKCPACGNNKKHRILFSQQHRQVLHECTTCTAVWGENTVVRVDDWFPQQTPTDIIRTVESQQKISREPISAQPDAKPGAIAVNGPWRQSETPQS